MANKSIKLKDYHYIDSRGIVFGHDTLNYLLSTFFYHFQSKYYAGQTLNLNDFVDSGIYSLDTNNTTTNKPPVSANTLDYLIVIKVSQSNSNNMIQIYINSTSSLFYRTREWGTWKSWKKINLS